MKVGWFETMQTPYQVIMDDLEMIGIEEKLMNSQTSHTSKKVK